MYSSISIMCFYINNKSGKLDKNTVGQNYWRLSNKSSDTWIQDGKHDWKKYNLSDSYTCPGNRMWQKQALKEIYGNFCTFISR